MSEIAGRVLMIPKGTYSPTTTYDPLDAVKYEQNSYVCKQTSRGNLPTNTTYWQPLTDVTADEIPTEGSTNLVQSGGVYSALTTINQTLTSAFTNNVNVYGSKNLLPNKATTQVSYGVTFTVNDDGSVKANGTNDGTQTSAIFPFVVARNLIADYFPSMDETYVGYMSASNTLLELLIIWEDENKTTISQTRTKTKVEFTIPSNAVYFRCDFRVAQNATVSNEIAYPMICLKSIYDLDDTFEPYTKTNQQLTEDSVTWDNLSEVGAVNHLKNNATTTTTTDGTTTFTWTVNDDKSVTVSAPSYPVTVASNQILIPWDNISADECSNLVGKVFKLSGCPSGGSRDTYRLQIYRVLSADGSSGTAEEYGEGNVFTWKNNGSGTKAKVQMVIASGYTMTGPITFKPMLTDLSYNGPYVPYAMTNRELTEINEYEVDTTSISNVTIMKRNNVVTVKVNGSFNIVHNQNYVVGQLPERFRPPLNVVSPIVTNEGTPKLTVLAINSTGQIEINGYMIATSGTYPFDGIMTFVTNK